VSRNNALRAGALAPRTTQSPARRTARASHVISVNMLFWKILVTRVNSFLRKARAAHGPAQIPSRNASQPNAMA
jgi:hypothetical protein